jgi:hypothetical protein
MLKGKLETYQQQSDNKFYGIYRGVIEDRDDPEKRCRVKVRVFGIHTDDINKNQTKGVPTDDLPWAEPCHGLFEGSISGFGSWAVPLHGSHVFLFFENGNPTQPRYFATSSGVPEEVPDKTKGFNDPDGVYPRPDRIGESDVHRLMRSENITETLVQTKNDNLDGKDTPIETADNLADWSEPESAYEAEYPDNIVMVTHAGITVEFDNTPNKRRVHIYHPSNSYIEINEEGRMVIRNNDDKYEIVLGDHNIHIAQDENTTIDGDRTRKVVGDESIDIDGNQKRDIIYDQDLTVGGNQTETIDLNRTTLVKQNVDITIGEDETRIIEGSRAESTVGNEVNYIEGNKTENIVGNRTNTIDGNQDETIQGHLNITITGQCTIDCKDKVTINADATVEIDGGSGAPIGVVQGNCICALTGQPHMNVSATVKSSY